MLRVSFLLLISFSLASAVSVFNCKSTFWWWQVRNQQIRKREYCTLMKNTEPENENMCTSTDINGELSGYYTLPDGYPQLCYTAILKYNQTLGDGGIGEQQVTVQRGPVQLGVNVTTCQQVCNMLRTSLAPVRGLSILYVGCDAKANSNDEDLSDLDFATPTWFTCKDDNNFAKPGDSGRPPSWVPMGAEVALPQEEKKQVVHIAAPVDFKTMWAERLGKRKSPVNEKIIDVANKLLSNKQVMSRLSNLMGTYMAPLETAEEPVRSVAHDTIHFKDQTRDDTTSGDQMADWEIPLSAGLAAVTVVSLVLMVVQIIMVVSINNNANKVVPRNDMELK